MTGNPSQPALDEHDYNRAVYEIFDHFALKDQEAYYKDSTQRYRTSAREVSRLRATLAFATGVASAASGLIVGLNPGACVGTQTAASAAFNCGAIQLAVGICVILTVILPALAAAFNILSDLYQWDRLITIYRQAQDSMILVDAQSPQTQFAPPKFRAALDALVEGTLGVMTDETAQWGQIIRTPPTIEEFLKDAEERANESSHGAFESGKIEPPKPPKIDP